jgi:hypothetical protein
MAYKTAEETAEDKYPVDRSDTANYRMTRLLQQEAFVAGWKSAGSQVMTEEVVKALAQEYVDTVLAPYNHRYKEAGFKDYSAGLVKGYSLATEEIEALRREVEKWKGMYEYEKRLNNGPNIDPSTE